MNYSFPRLIALGFFISIIQGLAAQSILKPGFNPSEYADLLSIAFYSSSIPDSVERLSQKDPYTLLYKSEEVGFYNRWTFFQREDNVGVINIRGTVGRMESWLPNFFSAMIPAKGSLHLNDTLQFDYQLADRNDAMVQVGWTISLGYLAPDIEKKINAAYSEKGMKEYLIMGHSQGGAIAFLLRAWLEFEKRAGRLPADVNFKTYCSAGPKPGNLYFAYDYETYTAGGWGFNVVNAADWVPETPFSIQTLSDFNRSNIFIGTKKMLKQQKFFVRLAGNMLYNSLDKSTRKAQKKMCKYLGNLMYKQVHKLMPELEKPQFTNGNNYQRCGTPIVLSPDSAYYEIYKDSISTPFVHHMYAPYFYLLKKQYELNN